MNCFKINTTTIFWKLQFCSFKRYPKHWIQTIGCKFRVNSCNNANTNPNSIGIIVIIIIIVGVTIVLYIIDMDNKTRIVAIIGYGNKQNQLITIQ